MAEIRSPGVSRKLICGNWKMNHDHLETIAVLTDLSMRLATVDLSRVEVVVHPPFPDLRSAQTVIEDRAMPVRLGAQNCNAEDAGAFTGEVSAPMLARLGVSHVIVGHSERRRLFGETDADVAAKIAAVLRSGMTPIVCVGEDSAERDGGLTGDVLRAQVEGAMKGYAVAAKAAKSGGGEAPPVFAYEPLWAIGTGNAAGPEDASVARNVIESEALERRSPAGHAGPEPPVVLYGGSVVPENAAGFVVGAAMGGLLVGGASLAAAKFAAIVSAVAGVV